MQNFRFSLMMEIDSPGHVWESMSDRERTLAGLTDGQHHIDNGRKAESLGLDLITVADHLYSNPDALITCMAIAAATTSLKVTQTVLINDFRHPVQVAKAIASIDVFSNGRAEVGLGAGYNHDEFRQSGIPFDPPKARIGRLREGATIIKELLTSEDPVHFKGDYYTVDGLMGMPRPVQKPRPPLTLAGGGRLMLKLAGEIADVINITPSNLYPSGLPRDPREYTVDAFAEKVDWVKEGAGARFDDLLTGFPLVKLMVTDDRERAARELQAEFDGAYRLLHGHEDGFPLSLDEVLNSPFFFLGTHDEVRQELLDLRAKFGCADFMVLSGQLDDMSPIVKALKDSNNDRAFTVKKD